MWSWMLCLCTQRPEMALAYALAVWSAMAGFSRVRRRAGENWALTVGVVGDRMAVSGESWPCRGDAVPCRAATSM